jgi:hypothetical protein
MLRRSPGTTAAAIAVLALSIGATSAVFAVINTVVIQPLHYPHPEQLMVVFSHSPPRQNIRRP